MPGRSFPRLRNFRRPTASIGYLLGAIALMVVAALALIR